MRDRRGNGAIGAIQALHAVRIAMLGPTGFS
jgi:hypothetical protein